MIIAGMFEKYTDLGNANTPETHYFVNLEEFARIIMSIKPVLNNPSAFDKWIENEEIEFHESPIQEAMNEVSTSQSSSCDVRLITFYVMLYYFPSPGKVKFHYFQCLAFRIRHLIMTAKNVLLRSKARPQTTNPNRSEPRRINQGPQMRCTS